MQIREKDDIATMMAAITMITVDERGSDNDPDGDHNVHGNTKTVVTTISNTISDEYGNDINVDD